MSRVRCVQIGRHPDAHIVLDSRGASRRHAELVLGTEGGLYLSDCGSTRGTFVERDGTWLRVTQGFIQRGERVRFGDVEMSVDELVSRAEGSRQDVGATVIVPAAK